jgi:hypothetical protein
MTKTFGQRVAADLWPLAMVEYQTTDQVLHKYSDIIDQHDAKRMERLREKCKEMFNEHAKVAWGEYGMGVCNAARKILDILDDMEATDGND